MGAVHRIDDKHEQNLSAENLEATPDYASFTDIREVKQTWFAALFDYLHPRGIEWTGLVGALVSLTFIGWQSAKNGEHQSWPGFAAVALVDLLVAGIGFVSLHKGMKDGQTTKTFTDKPSKFGNVGSGKDKTGEPPERDKRGQLGGSDKESACRL